MTLILIIEDDAQSRKALRSVLEQDGHQVNEASNGKDGINAFRSEPADLIITDIVMPKKDGIETIVDLKIEYPEVKIIAISGGGRFGPRPYLEIAESFGADCILKKPISKKELLESIKTLLE